MNIPFEFLPPAAYLLQAGHGAAEPSGFWDTLLRSNLLNVLIVAGVIVWAFNKFQLGSAVGRQQVLLQKQIDDIEAQKKQALSQLKEVQQQTANLRSEVESILNQARQSADSLSRQMLQEAQLEAERIVEMAKKRVALEERSASKELQARLLEDALAIVRQRLSASLGEDEHQRAMSAFVAEIGQLPPAHHS
jgi:F-type H+-transporting ATPase subunit b